MLIDGDRLKVVNAPIARTKLGSATGQDVTFLQIALAAEVAARTAADAALSASIAAETAARAAADAALAADIATEAAARIAADNALDSDISDETAARIAAVSAEEAARIAADGVLTSDLAQEVLDRIAADTVLTNDLATETSERIAADNAIIAGIVRGTVAIGNAATSGSVTGLALAYTPASVSATVISPVGGLTLFASLEGDPTTDGFDFLVGPVATDSADYKLAYILKQ
jgi:hypothetical protein